MLPTLKAATGAALVIGLAGLMVAAVTEPVARAILLGLPPLWALVASAQRVVRQVCERQPEEQEGAEDICPVCGQPHAHKEVSRLVVGLLAAGLWLEGRGQVGRKAFYRHLGFDLGSQIYHRPGGAGEQRPARQAWILSLAILTSPRVLVTPSVSGVLSLN